MSAGLPALLDRPGDDIWTTQGIPEELAVRLMSAAGGSVTGVEIHPDQADIDEVTEQTCTARIQLAGPSGTRHVTARLDLGLTLAVVSGAPVLVADAVMDRLAVPVPNGDVLAAFGEVKPVMAQGERAIFMVDRRAGRVFQVASGLGGKRPRFEPRNMDFGEGLNRWNLESPAQDLVEEAAAQVWDDYSAAAEGRSAVLSSTSEKPRGSALLTQTIFADDYRGMTVAFGGEVRAEDVAASQHWSTREITVTIPEETDVIRFGITLAGCGRVWLRRPELRRERPQDAGAGDVG